MLNELEEYRAYTEPPVYTASGKRDNTYLGRFTFDMLMDFEGLTRVLTILARGFMWQEAKPDISRAKNALLAWCSVPGGKQKDADWHLRTAYPELHAAFPNLVDKDGTGWFCRHVHSLCRFVKEHPDSTGKTAQENCGRLASGFDAAWRDKVVQMQVPLFAPTTRAAWSLRFDDVLADAAELGPLRNRDFPLPPETSRLIAERLPEEIPLHAAETLVKYYAANRMDGTGWVVLPVTNFDAYFGSTVFSRKQLSRIPSSILTRENQSGISRYRVSPDLLAGCPGEEAR